MKYPMGRVPLRSATAVVAVALISTLQLGIATPAKAAKATDVLRDEIVVTARKKSAEEGVQDTPLAVTAFGEDQLEALQVRRLDSLAFEMPNVALDDVGTARGVANFSIRGLGINSSIPSIDPTVGVFVDGVYLGLNAGVVLDVFDLEAIEVLRGPQGVLFGRNVTGGAVLMRTKKPTEELEVSGKFAMDRRAGSKGGNNYTMAASASGPLFEEVLIKISGYANIDNGWHYNEFTGSKHGEADTYMFRPQVLIRPTEDIELLIRYEHGTSEGDGPAAQNRGLYDVDSFKFAVDETGYGKSQTDQLIAELNWDVEFGDGRITNIFGWRNYSGMSISDIDASQFFVFHAGADIDQEQFSNEIRYAGRFFDTADVTVGFYYLTQDLVYQENRNIPPLGMNSNFYGGGTQEHKTWGIFGASDITLIDNESPLILNLGLRVSKEKKDVRVANLTTNVSSAMGATPLDIPAGECDVRDFDATCTPDVTLSPDGRDGDDWLSVTPKIGLTYWLEEDTQIYGFWTRGFRSGGYNLRNTSVVDSPGPFDQEKQDAFEIGIKSKPDDRSKVNLALFYNKVQDLQREINLPDPVSGVVQLIRNTADARFLGFELEGSFLVTENLLFAGNLGYTNARYTDVIFDLNGDGMIDGDDEDLKLPRAAPWTVGASLVHDHEINQFGLLTSRLAFYHRDESFFTDNNEGTLNGANMLDFSMTLLCYDNDNTRFTIYANNLLNEATNGGETILPGTFPGSPDATFRPLNKGRTVGVEVNFTLN